MNIQIEIIPREDGGTEFLARPHRLHLGGCQAQGVDRLCFALPPAWAGLAVALYIRHHDGTQAAPIALGTDGSVPVDRRFTGWPSGQWMLAATGTGGYAAYTRPGSYDVYEVLDPTAAALPDPTPSLYEQFVNQVLASASSAAADAAKAQGYAAAGQQAAQTAQSAAGDAAASAQAALAAAQRAEGAAPAEGPVLSVNGKGGAVTLGAADVGALPLPASPVAGQLLRVAAIDPGTGALTLDTAAAAARTDPAYGLTTRADGTLATVGATEAQLDAMADLYAPLTPGRTPYAVKKVLTAFALSWTEAEKAAVRAALGAGSGSTDPDALDALDARLTALELQAEGETFRYSLATLTGLNAAGSWNESAARLEF